MEESKKFLISLLVVIVVVGILDGVGIYFYDKYKSIAVNQYQQASILNDLKSPVVHSISLYGKVKEVSNKAIILSFRNQDVSVGVDAKTKVFFFSGMPNNKMTPAKFSDIKVGQNVNMKASFVNDQLIGYEVFIIS
jgi:hypothetical protein